MHHVQQPALQVLSPGDAQPQRGGRRLLQLEGLTLVAIAGDADGSVPKNLWDGTAVFAERRDVRAHVDIVAARRK
jgi:hypothetical protein